MTTKSTARNRLLDRSAAYPERVASAARAASPIPGEWTPASTLLGVQSLARDEMLIEVECVAVVA